MVRRRGTSNRQQPLQWVLLLATEMKELEFYGLILNIVLPFLPGVAK